MSALNKASVLKAVLIGMLIAIAIAMYSDYRMAVLLKATYSQIESQKAELAEHQASYHLSDAAALQSKIDEGVERYFREQRAVAVRSKLDGYLNAPETVTEGKHIYGSTDARFTLVEWSDFECPYCRRFHPTLKSVVDGSKGAINWQWKHLPLETHNPAALNQAVTSECVAKLGGNRMFWAYIGDVFNETRGNGGGVARPSALLNSYNLDADEMKRCLSSPDTAEVVDNDIRKAMGFGIKSTPATFIVDNATGTYQLITGAQPAEAVTAVIRKMLVVAEQGG